MEDFDFPSAERGALLKRLQEAIGDVPPHFWAACQICDIGALEFIVFTAQISPGIVLCAAAGTVAMMQYWTENATREGGLHASSFPAGASTPNTPATSAFELQRNQTAATVAARRDSERCVLTGDAMKQVAHIYPSSSLEVTEDYLFGPRHMFWNQLEMFWPKETVAAWKAELFPGSIDERGAERIYNLITLSPKMHALWAHGAFALKPIFINKDATESEVQFFWQKKQTGSQGAMSLATTPFSTKNLTENKGACDIPINAYIYDGQILKSGDYFELHTDDPLTEPLPSFKLLEMRWFLARVAGMAGSCSPYEPDLGDEDDDDIGGDDEDSGDNEVYGDNEIYDEEEVYYDYDF